jgi:hypothetical protein
MRKKTGNQRDNPKEKKKKLEHYIADLLKVGNVNKAS